MIKASTLNRVAAHVASGKGGRPDDGPSVVEHYLDASYGRSQQPRYRMLMQALYSGRLLLLIDGSRGHPAGYAKKAADRGSKDSVVAEDLTKNVIDEYLLDRVGLEVPRIVVTGDFTAKEESALREKFVALEVRQGLKSDHDTGRDAWYMSQNERFSFQPAPLDKAK